MTLPQTPVLAPSLPDGGYPAGRLWGCRRAWPGAEVGYLEPVNRNGQAAPSRQGVQQCRLTHTS